MNEWALPTIAVLLIGYGALSGRLQSTVITQAMVFVALGLLVGNRALDLVEVDTANQYVLPARPQATRHGMPLCTVVRTRWSSRP